MMADPGTATVPAESLRDGRSRLPLPFNAAVPGITARATRLRPPPYVTDVASVAADPPVAAAPTARTHATPLMARRLRVASDRPEAPQVTPRHGVHATLFTSGWSTMVCITDDATIVPRTPPSPPRLFLTGAPPGRTILQGGWWPRSWDPVAELPGLVLALCARFGPIRGVDLNCDTWESHFSRLAVDAGVVSLGWPTTLDPALLIVIREHDHRIDPLDLLVVPPATDAASANQAMTTAANPANALRAPEILAATSAMPGKGPDPDSDTAHTPTTTSRHRHRSDSATSAASTSKVATEPQTGRRS